MKNNYLRFGMTIEEAEKNLIYITLEKLKGNKTRTAWTLGIAIKTLRNKIRKYQIDMPSEAKPVEISNEP